MLKRSALRWWAPAETTPRSLPSPMSVRMAALLTAGLGLLVLYGLVTLVERTSVIGDSLGYLYAAQRIAAGFGPTFDDANNALAGPYFSLYAFQIARADTHLFYLGFPPGLSLLLALPLLISPQSELVYWVVPLTALATLLLSGWLAWLLTRQPWASFWALLLLATTPVLWFFGTAFWSEFPSAAAIAGALALYLFAEQRPRRGWVTTTLLLGCGLLLFYSVFIRYSNVVVAPVFLAADALLLRREPRQLALRWPLWLLVGLAVIAIPLFNHVYYGGWNLTSYSPAHGWYPWPAFSLSYAFGPSFVDGYSLPAALETLWRNFGIFLLLAPIGWARLGRGGALLAGVALATLAIYALYAFAPAGFNARFLIPAFPMFAVGAAAAIIWLLAKVTVWPRALLVIALLLLALWPLPDSLRAAAERNAANTAQVAQVRSLTAASTPDSVFMSYPWNDLIAVYGERSVFNYRRVPVSDPATQSFRTEEAVPTVVAVVAKLLEQGKPVYYVDTGSNFWPDLLGILQTHFATEVSTQDGVTLHRLRPAASP